MNKIKRDFFITMGQCWEWICKSKKQRLCTHNFGIQLQYPYQFRSRHMYNAIVLLKTDISSLGKGGYDLMIDNPHPGLYNIIEKTIGLWFGENADFVGDYTADDVYEYTRDYEDISLSVTTTIIAIIIHDFALDNSKKCMTQAMDSVVQLLNEDCENNIENWQDTQPIKRIRDAIYQ